MRVSVLLLCLVLGSHAAAHEPDNNHGIDLPPWQAATSWPDRIVVTLPGSPQTSFAVTWRTNTSAESTVAQIVEARDDARFDLGAATVPAKTERLDLQVSQMGSKLIPLKFNADLPEVNFHSVVFEGLKPDTLYAYRVKGADDHWSEWFQTRTAAETGPVTFLYLGDAQNALRSHWSRLIRAGFQEAPKANFILHAGDLVNKASRDLEWAEWFEATGFIHGMIPAVPLAGNHEFDYYNIPASVRGKLLSILWRPQFTLPQEPALDADLQELVYDLRYTQDVHLFALSTQSAKLEQQATWLDGQLTASNAKWKIVTMHHPIFSSGKGRDDPDRRAALLPIIRKHKVDLVLQGHDHTYARGAIAQSPKRLAFNAKGGKFETMFVNSVSGPKQYPVKKDGWDGYSGDGVNLIRAGENTQFFQIITIDGDTLSYAAHTATGALYDDFEMKKSKSGIKKITRGATSTMEERTFSNSGDYKKP